MGTLKKIFDLLTTSERKQVLFLLGLVLLMAFVDMLGIASIMPFMAVLANPQIIESNDILATAYEFFDFESEQTFLFALGLIVFIFLITSLAIKALTTYVQIRFVLMREFSIGKRLIEFYLHQPYISSLSRHSADLGKTILSEVNQVIGGCLMPLLHLIAYCVVSLSILLLLLLVDPILAVTVGSFLGIAYGVIFSLISRFLLRIGKERTIANQKRFNVVSEAFGSVKEVKVGGLEQAFINQFASPAKTYAQHQSTAAVAAQLPRFMLEAITFGCMLLMLLTYMAHGNGLAEALPIITLYAFAAYRLIPALQYIHGSLSQIRFSTPALEVLHKDLMESKLPKQCRQLDSPLLVNSTIQLCNINFSYPNSEQAALHEINLTIPAHSIVALVGHTGSGKTTLADLIIGLLDPQKGELMVDGKVIDQSNRSNWQKSIGYVPQQIYLADTSISENIAFGINADDIDNKAVEQASKIANIHDFISELPNGFATVVGERGVRLSGGQRQRIGLARALYKKPKLLVLDEATSALDNVTEEVVIDAINNLGNDATIILIAHRLSTIQRCDRIYVLEGGRIKDQGTYIDLKESCPSFQAMLKTAQ